MPLPFPSLVLSHDGHQARGSFAAIQAACLQPDPTTVRTLDELLANHKIGIVAHYYMDPELQGVLYACTRAMIHVSDSLVMADQAVTMVRQGAQAIVVLGVDFMAENARALLDAAGMANIPVYRVASATIGCSLADAAESPAYRAYLDQAAADPGTLHVVYINTSLRSKAWAHHVLPTITCTSANVVRTVLTALAEVDDASVWFGPDSYMGQNLATMLDRYANLPATSIAALHPAHTAATLRRARARFHWFKQGNCIVHHHFGGQITEAVRADYGDALLAAHLEVPGELFELALDASAKRKGVVGSTSNILDFIVERTQSAARNEHVRVVLGTEAGMTAAIVHKLQPVLARRENHSKKVEIIFPVAQDAVAIEKREEGHLQVWPGVAGSEGCSTAGGCATCPYMKMNSLDALLELVPQIAHNPRNPRLAVFEPRRIDETLDGKSMAQLGTQPILAMRAFQKDGHLPASLIERIRQRVAGSATRHAEPTT